MNPEKPNYEPAELNDESVEQTEVSLVNKDMPNEKVQELYTKITRTKRDIYDLFKPNSPYVMDSYFEDLLNEVAQYIEPEKIESLQFQKKWVKSNGDISDFGGGFGG